jgi:hypothetical protein
VGVKSREMLQGGSEEQRNQQERTWENNITMDLKETGKEIVDLREEQVVGWIL